jgi:hypothetical protein
VAIYKQAFHLYQREKTNANDEGESWKEGFDFSLKQVQHVDSQKPCTCLGPVPRLLRGSARLKRRNRQGGPQPSHYYNDETIARYI